MDNTSSVLIVGGSLVGLSSAVFLAAQSVRTILVEKRAGSSAHPRAIGFRERTLEAYRSVGLEPRIAQVAPGFQLRRVKVESLAGRWFDDTVWTPGENAAERVQYSPCTGAAIAQDKLEPILRERALELGADLRFETELLHFTDSGSGIVARLRHADASQYDVRADYLIAADGHRSPVRSMLGIARSGRGHIRTVRSVLFRAPLEQYLKTGVHQFEIEQPGLSAFMTTYGDGRWVLMFFDDLERDEATLLQLIQKAIGRTDLPIEIIVTGRWELGAQIADVFSQGRVFLAGDAAHTLPPNRGAYGANTGIEDAHNLAWKLAAVLSGSSAPALLDTYDDERRPIAWLRHDQIFARDDYKKDAAPGAEPVALIGDAAMELGQLYRSAAVLGAGSALPPAASPDLWRGQPGTRAPHCSLEEGKAGPSTLDWFGGGWTLLAHGPEWAEAARQAGSRTGIALRLVQPGADFDPALRASVFAAFGLDADGASLVRPDGYVAWRSAGLPENAAAQLTQALGEVSFALSRPPTGD